MNYYCDHNICPMQTSLPLATDTVMVNSMLHLQQVSDVLGIDIEQLRALNPQYKRDIIPGNTEPSVLKLPASQTYAFVDKEDSVYTHRIEELLANCIPVNAADGSKNLTLEKIIRKWNGLGSNRVAKGRRLRLHVDNGGVAFASVKTKKTEKDGAVKAGQKATPVVTKSNQTARVSGKSLTYKVQSGDSLYSIAKKYPGVSTDDLQRANGLTSADIRPGQVLKIPVV